MSSHGSAPARTLSRGHAEATVRRRDAVPKVKGEFAYASDLHAAGMLWGQTVRSPHAHARVTGIDVSAALALPGVHAVLTHDDIPGDKLYGLEFRDQPVLAIDRVRYFGEPVVVVAADEPEQARRAAAAVRVDYEPLEPVVDPARATEMEPLHPDRPTMGIEHGYRDDARPNVVRSLVISRGDPDLEGDVSVSGVYEIGQQDQAFLGPESGIAIPDGEGGVDIHVATQWLHVDRDQVAPCLGLEPEQVRIHLAGVGGAFGGREDLSMQIHAAMLALHTARPVKMVYGREESFVGHVHRHPATIWAEHRATRAGKLVSVRMRILIDGGAYASSSTAVISNACAFAVGPYAVDNVLLDGLAVYTNNPPCGAMRGFGAVQTCFAAEAQMDKLAAELEIDPVELRLLNALESGGVLATGQVITGSLPTKEVIRRAAALERPRAGGAPARRDPVARRRREHHPRGRHSPRRRLRCRVQEHLLLGGLRRLLYGASPARRFGERRGSLRGCRGRPGCLGGDSRGRAAGARGDASDRARRRDDLRGGLGRLGIGFPHDVDGGRCRPACLSCGPRRAAPKRWRRGRRRADLPPPSYVPARSRDGADRPTDRRTSPSRSPRCGSSSRSTSTWA